MVTDILAEAIDAEDDFSPAFKSSNHRCAAIVAAASTDCASLGRALS